MTVSIIRDVLVGVVLYSVFSLLVQNFAGKCLLILLSHSVGYHRVLLQVAPKFDAYVDAQL